MGAFRLRALFVLVASLTAATLIDPLLETLSNYGFFGAGQFTDNSTADVVPGLIVAFSLSMLFVALCARRQWLRDSLRHLERRTVYRLLPLICVVQLLVLWSMETAEQSLVVGHMLGGLVWLGAPALIALAAHALGGAVVAVVLSRALQAIAARVVHVVRRVLGAFAPRCPGRPVDCRRSNHALPLRVLEPLLRRVAGRAPPRPSIA